jgi:hypothetical protein
MNRGMKRVDVRLTDLPLWLAARWLGVPGDTVSLASGEAGATLEVRVSHDSEGDFRGVLGFAVADRVVELSVRMTARRSDPVAHFSFNGAVMPAPFDFGDDGRPYELSIANATSVPLVVTFSDLPPFLAFEVDGRHRNGPIDGPFFERIAPFVVSLRPRLFGSHDGSLRLRTNDPRPQWQDIELQFTSSFVAVKPFVHVAPPRRTRMRADQKITLAVRLENWSRSAARTSKHAVPRFLEVREWPVVPAAQNGEPGSATLPLRIAPTRLAAGVHTLSLAIRIEDGEPAIVDVPIELEVLSRRNAALRFETVAALFALLLITLLFVMARGF